MLKVIGYNFAWKEVVPSTPIDEVKGMSQGVREDFIAERRNMAANWCMTNSDSVCYWVVDLSA